MALQSLKIRLVASQGLGNQATAFSGIAIDGKFPGSRMRGLFTRDALQIFQHAHPSWGSMQNSCDGSHVEAQGYWRPANPEENGLMNMKTKSIFVVVSCTITPPRKKESSTHRGYGSSRERMNDTGSDRGFGWGPYARNFMFAERHQSNAHCRTLGLDAMPKSKTELRTAWMKRIRETHPDTGGCEREAMMVNAAYQALLPTFG